MHIRIREKTPVMLEANANPFAYEVLSSIVSPLSYKVGIYDFICIAV